MSTPRYSVVILERVPSSSLLRLCQHLAECYALFVLSKQEIGIVLREQEIFGLLVDLVCFQLTFQSELRKQVVDDRSVVDCHISGSIYDVLVADLEICIGIYDIDLVIRVVSFHFSSAFAVRLPALSSILYPRSARSAVEVSQLIAGSLNVFVEAVFIW